MEHEASPFETSEILATLLGSSLTPLISESWKLCGLAHGPTTNFVIKQTESVGYVGFSSVSIDRMMMMISSAGGGDNNLVTLDSNHDRGQLFAPLLRQINEGEPPILVHTASFDLFLAIYNSPDFYNQMVGMMEKSKSIVITGHSIGGTIACLTTLWLLSCLQPKYPKVSVLCITFGSPLLGNESLSRAILRERWDGNFCHVVSKHDIIPRFPFASSLSQHLHLLHSFLTWWHSSSPHDADAKATNIYQFVTTSMRMLREGGSLLQPFGSYLFCSEHGAICLDNPDSVVNMMHLTLLTAAASPSLTIQDHLKYGDYIEKISLQFLKQKRSVHGEDIPDQSSCYEAGISMALQSLGIASQDAVAEAAKDCLTTARRMGRKPNLNVANLAIKLSKITPYRAEIEWYKACCDDSEDNMGYYDSFKLRGASKRDARVNMNRIKLGRFWDDVIDMLDKKDLPHDFHRRGKWVNASHFYKLLVEPLDIADYYRQEMHLQKGHYMKNGRERRYKIFDGWWKERRGTEKENDKRSRLASLTQDSCFWARLEEAKDWLENFKEEGDTMLVELWGNIVHFETYALTLIESKQVSKDVLAKNSSYTQWAEELRQVKKRKNSSCTRSPEELRQVKKRLHLHGANC